VRRRGDAEALRREAGQAIGRGAIPAAQALDEDAVAVLRAWAADRR
jgi:hypothetical protein